MRFKESWVQSGIKKLRRKFKNIDHVQWKMFRTFVFDIAMGMLVVAMAVGLLSMTYDKDVKDEQRTEKVTE